MALQGAVCPDAREAVCQSLLDDSCATTTARRRGSFLRTWLFLHDRAFQSVSPKTPPYLITPEAILAIASLFKAAGYLSYYKYLPRACQASLTVLVCSHPKPPLWHPPLASLLITHISDVSQ